MFFSGVCLGQPESRGNAAAIEAPHDASVEKVEEWQSRRNVVGREYNVCLEHCARDISCEDNCEAAYRSRLVREYRSMFNKR